MTSLEYFNPSNVKKRDGSIVTFNQTKIQEAINKAFNSVSMSFSNKIKEKLMDTVFKLLTIDPRCNIKEHVDIEIIQDIVETALIKEGYVNIAKEYMKYREEKKEIRNQKKKLLQVTELSDVEKRYSYDALRIFKERYLLKDNEGNTCERLDDLFKRVAVASGIMEVLYHEKFYDKNGYQSNYLLDLKTVKKDFANYQKTLEDFDYKNIIKESPVELGNGFLANNFHLERLWSRYIELVEEHRMKVKWSDVITALTIDPEIQSICLSLIQKYYDLMANRFFLPNTPMLMNAGTKLSQGAACFTLAIEDSVKDIYQTKTDIAEIFQSGGGIGINYDKLRPRGSLIKSTGGKSPGAVHFLLNINTDVESIAQGGKRRGAAMGILSINHPDIVEFIKLKNNKTKKLESHNISVNMNNKFFDSFFNNKDVELTFNGKPYQQQSIKAQELMNMIITNAHECGDPGAIFEENMNSNNLLYPVYGYPIKETNPCSEISMYPYDSCNLASINLTRFVTDDGRFNLLNFIEVCDIVTQFLDGVVDSNKYPVERINEVTKQGRRIGLGYMGLGDVMTTLNIPYNSEQGFVFIEYLTAVMTAISLQKSAQMAKTKGPFPMYNDSNYPKDKLPVNGCLNPELIDDLDNRTQILNDKILGQIPIKALFDSIEYKKYGLRNCSVTTIAPTGTLSMFHDISHSSGVEPVFSHGFTKKVTVGEFNYVNSNLESKLKGLGIYSDKLIEKIVKHNGGKLSGIDEIPQEVKDVFITSMEIHPFDHIMAQAVAQRWITNGISKTINAPNDIPAKDIEYCYILAWAMGSKGTTVYRDGSKHEQVLNNSSIDVQIPYGDLKVSNYTLNQIRNNERLPNEYKDQLLDSCNVPTKTYLKLSSEIVKDLKIICPKCNSLNTMVPNGSRCQLCMSCGHGIGSCE